MSVQLAQKKALEALPHHHQQRMMIKVIEKPFGH